MINLSISFPHNVRVLAAALACLSAAACGGDDDAQASTSGGAGGAGGQVIGPECLDERQAVIGPVDKVSVGDVTILSEAAGVKTMFIDASAGGINEQPNNPWVYLNLGTASRVDITDVAADTSLEWDLAWKRPEIRTNSGPGAAGQGGAAFLRDVAFDTVTKEIAASAALRVEDWFDDSCKEQLDPGGFTRTTFDAWYDYGGEASHLVTPHPGTFVVRGAKGSLYKLELQSYYSNPDGTDGLVSARYLLRLAAL